MMAEITACLSSEDGWYFHGGYADSLCVTPGRLYVRENYGISAYGHGLHPQLVNRLDIQSIPGYTKTGDGFQVVSNVGCSPDGARVLAGWKTDSHGTLDVQFWWPGHHAHQDGLIVGEFAPPRALGGVTVAKAGDRYLGYSLAGSGLWRADVTAEKPGKMKSVNVCPTRGTGLITAGTDTVVYVSMNGDLVAVAFDGFIKITPMQALCVASEGDVTLVGVVGGMKRLGGPLVPLPGNPGAVCLLGGVAYAFVTVDGTQRLFREGEQIFELPAGTWPVAVAKGFDRWIYAGVTTGVLVIRVD